MRLHLLCAAEAVFDLGGLGFFVGLADEIELRQRLGFQLRQIGRGDGCGGGFVVLVVIHVVVRRLFSGRVFGPRFRFEFNKAIDQFVDADLVLFNLCCHVQNLLDGERA